MKTLQNLKSVLNERDGDKAHTINGWDEKGVLKYLSSCCRYFVIIFHLLHKAIVGCWRMKAASYI